MRWRYLLILFAAAAGNLIASAFTEEDAGKPREFNLPTPTDYGIIDNRRCSGSVDAPHEKIHDTESLAAPSGVVTCKNFSFLIANIAEKNPPISAEGQSGRLIAPNPHYLHPEHRFPVAP